jgi:RHS repeat-associated protein
MKDQAGNIADIQYDKAGRETMRIFSTSSNATNNVEDFSTLVNWINNIVCDARWDLNADGSVTTADYAYYPEKTLGRGKLSWVNNRIGCAGYQHAPQLAGTKWHVRHRALDAERGEWLTRDPAGFIDGKNLYQYARSRPLVGVDPIGLQSVRLAGCGVMATHFSIGTREDCAGAVQPRPVDCLQQTTHEECVACCHRHLHPLLVLACEASCGLKHCPDCSTLFYNRNCLDVTTWPSQLDCELCCLAQQGDDVIRCSATEECYRCAWCRGDLDCRTASWEREAMCIREVDPTLNPTAPVTLCRNQCRRWWNPAPQPLPLPGERRQIAMD